MQNYIVVFVMHWLLQDGPMSAPNALGTPASSPIGGAGAPPIIIPNAPVPLSRLHAGILLAALAVVVFWFLLWRTSLGYELRAVARGAPAPAQGRGRARRGRAAPGHGPRNVHRRRLRRARRHDPGERALPPRVRWLLVRVRLRR